MRNDVIAVLDLGSTKVVCMIAHIDGNGRMTVTGIGHQVSKGVRAGIVIDVMKAESAIISAVSAAEKMAGENIDKVYVNVSGGSLLSHKVKAETSISGHEITDRDINQIIAQGKKHFDSDDLAMLHCFPGQYAIDDTTGIINPRGMFGNALRTDLHLITCSPTATKNVVNCLAKCHLNVQDFVASPYVAGLSCLTEDEKNLGVTLVDMGGGCTTVAIFVGGNNIHTDVFPVGGNHVTRDIALGLSISTSYAERIKTLYGSVIETNSNAVIDIPFLENEGMEEDNIEDSPEMMNISRDSLTNIIKPRMEEILEMVKAKAELTPGGQMVGSRVVLTGGASQVSGLKELANHIFKKKVRIGRPEHIEGLAESTRGPAFSTPIGMLMHAAMRYESSGGKVIGFDSMKKKGQIDKVMRWLQHNF